MNRELPALDSPPIERVAPVRAAAQSSEEVAIGAGLRLVRAERQRLMEAPSVVEVVDLSPRVEVEVVDLPAVRVPVSPPPLLGEGVGVRWEVAYTEEPAALPLPVEAPGSLLSEYGAVREELGRLKALLGGGAKAPDAGIPPAPPAAIVSPVVPLVSTTSLEECKENLQLQGERIRNLKQDLRIMVKVHREYATARLPAGLSDEPKTWDEYFQYMIDDTRGLEHNRVIVNALRGLGVVNDRLDKVGTEVEKLYWYIDQFTDLAAREPARLRTTKQALIEKVGAVHLGLDLEAPVVDAGVDLDGEAPATGMAGEADAEELAAPETPVKKAKGVVTDEEELDG